eukprot:TRINITY_DN26137_c0_g1_i1.p1 TRINITY_DN26137_c0_g1~~TRINITY_DN26137_c0_g1_i1.p1  ORF type:complete len:399 (+),score=176.92 TRINITY_DN26137_c0_g1_i1:104-1198(+)
MGADTYDAAEQLYAAVAAADIDWAGVRRAASLLSACSREPGAERGVVELPPVEVGAEPPDLGPAPFPRRGEVVEFEGAPGITVVDGVSELDVLATFHDQGDARRIIEQAGAAEGLGSEHWPYSPTRVDRDVGSAEAEHSYRRGRAEAARLQLLAARSGEQGRAAVRSAADCAAVRKVRVELCKLRSSVDGMEAAVKQRWRQLAALRRDASGRDALATAAPEAALQRRLAACTDEALRRRRRLEATLQHESAAADLSVQECQSRTAVEKHASTDLLRLRLRAVQCAGLAWLAEEETDLRAGVLLDYDASWGPAGAVGGEAARLAVCVRRRADIAAIESALARGRAERQLRAERDGAGEDAAGDGE